MKKKKLNRWLRALGIAKIIFDNEGYHTVYLEEIEDFIKRNFGLMTKKLTLTDKEKENGFEK